MHSLLTDQRKKLQEQQEEEKKELLKKIKMQEKLIEDFQKKNEDMQETKEDNETYIRKIERYEVAVRGQIDHLQKEAIEKMLAVQTLQEALQNSSIADSTLSEYFIEKILGQLMARRNT